MADLPMIGGPAAWASRINAQLGMAVEAIISTGRELIAAKAALKHGEWERMFASHPNAIANPLRFSVRTAQKLVTIAEHPLLSNASNWTGLPPKWTTLYQLSKLPVALLEHALAEGDITPDFEATDVRELAGKARDPGAKDKPATQAAALSALDRDIERHMEAWQWRPEIFLG